MLLFITNRRKVTSEFTGRSPLSTEDTSDSDSSFSSWEEDSSEESFDSDVESPAVWTSDLSFEGLNKCTSSLRFQHNLSQESSELDYFTLFFDLPLLQQITSATNKYARSKTMKNTTNKKWKDTSVEEIEAYIGILIYMGLVDLSEVKDYFIGDFCLCPSVRQVMTYNRYVNISEYFRLNEDERKDSKIQPVLDIVEKFRLFYEPGCSLSVDETMVGFKERFIKTEQSIFPTKNNGIKVWALADSKTGYMLNCKVYLGKNQSNKNSSLSLGEQIVLEMIENCTGKWYHIYFNNFFTSYKLMELLLDRRCYACGTTDANIKNWPGEFRKISKLKKGEYKQLQSNKITATIWHDVLLLSTNSDPTTENFTTRHSGREKIDVRYPEALKKYTENIGGVKKANELRERYGVGRTSKKWWKSIFHFITNVAIVNSFILYDITNKPKTSAHGNRQLQFRKNLIAQLIGRYASRKMQRNLLPLQNENRHSVEKIDGRGKVCVYCSANKKQAASGRGVQTSFQCKQCVVPLCRYNCFLKYHSEKNIECVPLAHKSEKKSSGSSLNIVKKTYILKL